MAAPLAPKLQAGVRALGHTGLEPVIAPTLPVWTFLQKLSKLQPDSNSCATGRTPKH